MNLFEFDRLKKDFVVGTDEAGRGPAAGGVFAAAVYFNDISVEKELTRLNDSKKLSKKVREELFEVISKNTINSVVCIEVEEIESINILNSSLKAMKLACENVIKQVGENCLVLVDGNKLIKDVKFRQEFVIKGDSKSASIAAASILAKVTRDNYMDGLDKKYPCYGWKKNAGYLTKEHIDAILKYGICEYHRKSFLKKLQSRNEQLSLF